MPSSKKSLSEEASEFLNSENKKGNRDKKHDKPPTEKIPAKIPEHQKALPFDIRHGALRQGEQTPDKPEQKTIIDTMESEKMDPILSEILDNDDKLLFSLNALGSLQKNEKLTEKGNLLSVDDRWVFQGLRRWWTADNKTKSSNKTLQILTTTAVRINKLLDDDYEALLKYENKSKFLNEKVTLETPEEKRFRENGEERRRLINKYFVALSQAKIGIENIRDTYTDKYTQNKFKLSIQKADDILDKLQKIIPMNI
jgi:hypothetical protein